MNWNNPFMYKRSSVSADVPNQKDAYGGIHARLQQGKRTPFYSNYHPLMAAETGGYNLPSGAGNNSIPSFSSFYMSLMPLYGCDWEYSPFTDSDCIALASYKEGYHNSLQILSGTSYRSKDIIGGDVSNYEDIHSGQVQRDKKLEDSIEGFDFESVAEVSVEYPITCVQWDPSISTNNNHERLATSLDILRLYKVERNARDNSVELVQTHALANSVAGATSGNHVSSRGGKAGTADQVTTLPPLTSFDWNKVDPSLVITSSVDTTCTVWDLNRSNCIGDLNDSEKLADSAGVKTQLIAHDSEIFDVKFIHNSVNIFASVGNDGSMRVFDLRSLEHSTIIYEPSSISSQIPSSTQNYNSHALLRLSTSNIDQHTLATIGVNSNHIILIDMRMPGLPMAILDGSFGDMNTASINSITWHPSSNYLLSGGDDCEALVWDCNNLCLHPDSKIASSMNSPTLVENPSFAYQEDLEVNNVCWKSNLANWFGVVSGKGFQAVQI